MCLRLDAIALGSCRWNLRASGVSPRPTALLTLAPLGDAGLALLLLELDERAEWRSPLGALGAGFVHLLRLATPTVPPMARLPVRAACLALFVANARRTLCQQ